MLVAGKKITAGIVILLLAAAFVIWSVAFKDWCEQHPVWGQLAYGEKLGTCIKEKSLFSF